VTLIADSAAGQWIALYRP